MTYMQRKKTEELRQGIINLCAINAKMDDSHKFYITPNFIKNQLNIGYIKSIKRVLEDEEIKKLVEETNKKQLGFPSFLFGEPSPKHPQYEAYQEARKHNLRFTGKAFKRNEQGQLLFIVEAMQAIWQDWIKSFDLDNISRPVIDEICTSFLENTLEQQAIAVIQNPNILGMLPYRYSIDCYIKDKTAKERPSLYNVVKKTALLSDSNNSISPISEDLLLPNSSGVLNGRIKGHYIYFLVCGEEVVYIGYSYNINRIKDHTSCKSFTKIYYVLYDGSSRHSPSVESFLIQRFKTKYNRCHIAQKMGYHKITPYNPFRLKP